jgi:hypothetical protein
MAAGIGHLCPKPEHPQVDCAALILLVQPIVTAAPQYRCSTCESRIHLDLYSSRKWLMVRIRASKSVGLTAEEGVALKDPMSGCDNPT